MAISQRQEISIAVATRCSAKQTQKKLKIFCKWNNITIILKKEGLILPQLTWLNFHL